MKKMISTTVLFIFTTVAAFAQNEVKIYKTYSDYLAKTPSVTYKELIAFSPNYSINRAIKSLFDPILQVIDDSNQKQKVSVREDWGFEYKNILFRNSDAKYLLGKQEYSENRYYAFVDTISENLFFWENAVVTLNKYISVKMGNDIDYGETVHFTNNINGDFIAATNTVYDLVKISPELNNLVECYCENTEQKIGFDYKNKKTGEVNCDYVYNIKFLAKTAYGGLAKKMEPEIEINRECLKKIKSAK